MACSPQADIEASDYAMMWITLPINARLARRRRLERKVKRAQPRRSQRLGVVPTTRCQGAGYGAGTQRALLVHKHKLLKCRRHPSRVSVASRAFRSGYSIADHCNIPAGHPIYALSPAHRISHKQSRGIAESRKSILTYQHRPLLALDDLFVGVYYGVVSCQS